MTTYSIGTASVENGETTVTFAGASLGTATEPTLRGGDLFAVPGQPMVPPQRLISVDYGTETAELWAPWPGATIAAAAYEVRFVDDGVRKTAQTRRYLELLGQLSSLGLQPNAFGELADRDAYDEEAAGFIFLEVGDPWTLYIKLSATAADWDDGQTMEGAPGAPGSRGWSPVYAIAVDGARRVKQLVGYVGGEGTAPTAGVGQYVGPAGYVTDIAEATDIRGPAGIATDGEDGADGTDPGVLLTWNDDTADANPGGGGISADNADLSAATMLFVSKTNRAGNNIASWLLGLASSTSTIKGQLTLTRSGGNAQVLFNFSAVTDATGYVKLSVSGHSGATALVDGNALSLQASKTGNAGEGDGDVVGPAGAINNRVAVFDGTTGKLLKDGGIVLGTAAATNTGTSAGNVPVLNGSGKLDNAVVPAVAIVDVFVVASQVAMLALSSAEQGDVAIRTDLNKSFVLSTNSYATLADWKELLTPTDAVLSVAGLTGAISASGLKTALAIAQADVVGLTTASSPQFAAIELGAATDTTLSRSAAGVVAVEGVVVPTISSTNTLSNKRVKARVTTIASSATPTVNTDNTDVVDITALAAAITSMTTNLSGTPDIGDVLIYQIKDNGTARAITWGASFAAAGVALPTTTVISKRLTVGFMWNGTTWGCVGSAQEA